jgi:hypothetical protein
MPNRLRNVAKCFYHAFRELDPSPYLRIRQQMLRNRSNRDAIFIHIPKTAGTSLISVLELNGAMSLMDGESARSFFRNRGLTTFNHISLPSLVKAGILSREYLQRAWKFTFVRNPYDRAVSLYTYFISDQSRRMLPTTTFSIFCSYLEQGAYEPIGLYNWNGLSQLNPQVAWLRDDDGTLFCDFVGKFENLDSDFEQVSQTLRLRKNAKKLPRENRSSRLPIQSYYSDREMEIVAKVYAKDFAQFGYDPTRLPEGKRSSAMETGNDFSRLAQEPAR